MNLHSQRGFNKCRYGKEIVKSRLSYIEDIACNLGNSPQYFPTPDQEKLYQDALGHVVHVLSGKRCPMPNADVASDQVDERRKREHRMIRILNKLRYMERRRLYDPPSNKEIGYYRLIKKIVIPMAIFSDLDHCLSSQEFDSKFACVCFSPFSTLHYVEESAEVHRHLSHISDYVLEMDIRNGYDLEPLLGITDEVEAPEIHCGSQKRNNKFYHHKFNLAFMDLRCSHHSRSPPSAEEKKCYEQVLSLIVPCSITSKCEANPYFDAHLLDSFEESLLGDARSLEKLCSGIAKVIIKKLSFPESWETVMEHCVGSRYIGKDEDLDPTIVNFQRELLDKCEISYENLPNYIEDVGVCVQLMRYIHSLIAGLRHLKSDASLFLNEIERLGWEHLHALTLFNHSSSLLNESRKRNFVQKLKEKISGFNNQGNGAADESENNVEMLKSLVEEFKEIEDWHSKPLSTGAERQVIHKICQNVVSSTHFFTCTLAYEQMTYVIQNHVVDAHNKRGMKRKRCNDFSKDFYSSLYTYHDDIGNFIFMLQAFMDGLQEKLDKFQK